MRMTQDDAQLKEIHLQQVLLGDGSVFSIQWVDLPERHLSKLSPDFLLHRYYDLIRSFTLSMIRPVATASGVEFRLTGCRKPLLTFALPDFQLDGRAESVHLSISGGLLVQPGACDRGRLSLIKEPRENAVRITVVLADYCPLLLGSPTPSFWRRLLYRATQSYLHKVVTVRYLVAVCRELAGERVKARVEKAQIRDGKDI